MRFTTFAVLLATLSALPLAAQTDDPITSSDLAPLLEEAQDLKEEGKIDEARALLEEFQRKKEAREEKNFCVKKVFHAYCLGANEDSLPKPLFHQGSLYMFEKDTAVQIIAGRIATITRLYEPGTWLTYLELESALENLYGTPDIDRSFIPDYADDQSSIETAISLEKAQLLKIWNHDTWDLALLWDQSDHVGISYSHKGLRATDEARDLRHEGF